MVKSVTRGTVMSFCLASLCCTILKTDTDRSPCDKKVLMGQMKRLGMHTHDIVALESPY